jgi:hypothetical protein
MYEYIYTYTYVTITIIINIIIIIRKILPEIMDFFDLVDINGDGGVDFSEFVMFVIDEV